MNIQNNGFQFGFDFWGTSSSESEDSSLNYALPIIASVGAALGTFALLRNSPAAIRFVARHCPRGLNLASETLRSDPRFILSLLPQIAFAENSGNSTLTALLQKAEKAQEQELQQIDSILANASKSLQDNPVFILQILRGLKENASQYCRLFQMSPERLKTDSEFIHFLLNLKKMQFQCMETYVKLFEYSSNNLRNDRPFVICYLQDIKQNLYSHRELFDSIQHAIPQSLSKAAVDDFLAYTAGYELTLFAFLLENSSAPLKDNEDFLHAFFRESPDVLLLKYFSENLREDPHVIQRLIGLLPIHARNPIFIERMIQDVINAGLKHKIPFDTFRSFLESLPTNVREHIGNRFFKTITTTHDKIRENPQELLHQLYCCTLCDGLPEIKYENSRGLADGPLRDFIATLFQALCDPNTSHCPGDYEDDLLIPKLPFSADPDNIWVKQMFLLRAIGAVFGHALLNDRIIKVGIHFHPIVFQLLHALTEEEMDQLHLSPHLRSPEIMAEMEVKLTFLYLKHRYPLMFVEPGTSEKDLDEAIDRFLVHGKIPPNLLNNGIENVKEILDTYSVDSVIHAVQIIASSICDVTRKAYSWQKLVSNITPETFANRIQGVLSKDQISFKFDPLDVKTEGFLLQWIENASQEQLQKFAQAITGSTAIAPGNSLTIHCYQSGDPNRLPNFHSCVGTMDLPTDYPDYETFAARLNASLLCLEAEEGFQAL